MCREHFSKYAHAGEEIGRSGDAVIAWRHVARAALQFAYIHAWASCGMRAIAQHSYARRNAAFSRGSDDNNMTATRYDVDTPQNSRIEGSRLGNAVC